MALAGLSTGISKPRPISNAYNAAATQQAGDYDDIMHNYDDLYKQAGMNSGGNSTGSSTFNFTKLNPNFLSQMPDYSYTRSGDFGNQIGSLQQMSKTGGYSENDLNSLRERGISPIRSIYANAQRDIARKNSLQGGSMSNSGAIAAKMAREMSGQIGQATNRTNADIASLVAQGKTNALGMLNPLVSQENELMNMGKIKNAAAKAEIDKLNAAEQARVDAHNANIDRDITELTERNNQQGFNNQLNAVEGKKSLYGTTPALTHEFASQVLQNNAQQMQANQTANMLKNQRANIGLNLVQNQLRPSGLGRA